jgi:hypothetical protein
MNIAIVEKRARRANSAYFRIKGPLAGSRCAEAIEPRSFLSAAPHPIGGIIRRPRRIALPPGPPADHFLAILAGGFSSSGPSIAEIPQQRLRNDCRCSEPERTSVNLKLGSHFGTKQAVALRLTFTGKGPWAPLGLSFSCLQPKLDRAAIALVRCH